MNSSRSDKPQNGIAIVGMAGRFPGARTPDELWTLVRDGREAIRRLSDDDLRAAGVPDSVIAQSNYVKAAAILEGMDAFDAGFFGFGPRDAAIMDPQHRQFLECAWEALEDAGYVPEAFPGSIGVFGGCGMQGYFAYNLLNNAPLMRSAGLFLVRHTGNDKDFLATRVSYQLNLRGPSISVQTACSTSLVAVHLACQSLLAGECDMALAGGVTIEIPHAQGYLYEEGEILSPDGHCRAFDASSKGTVFGSGAGLVVLRRLEDAIAAGDHIEAVILGTAVNNDGAGKVGYLAPSVDGQAAVVAEALGVAGVDADSITYIETHGTGTPVGDPIEVAALTEAFRRHTTRKGFCAIGSIKTNIGHLDTAAGIASLIKVVQSLKHRQLAPSLHFETPNPLIEFPHTPFVVNSTLKPWTVPDGPRRAGVTSLGVGGTNAHVVLEEAEPAPSPGGKSPNLLVLSARSAAALDEGTARLANHFDAHPDVNIADVAWTLQTGRRAFDHRRIIVAGDATAAATELRAAHARRAHTGVRREPAPSLAFLFPGGGAQYPNMGREIYEREPAFRAVIDEGLAHLRSRHGVDLRPLLFPAPDALNAAARALEQSTNSILSVFLVEYALARLWMSWGVTPDVMTGHSLGEYTAACLAGVFSFEDALDIVKARGEMFDRMPAGAMLSVPLPESDLAPWLTGRLGIAALNAPSLSVISGPVDEIEKLQEALAAREVDSRRLHISVAAHSAMLEPHLNDFADRVRRVRLSPPSIPFISNVSGRWAEASEVTDHMYWVQHLRRTVRFSDGLRTILQDTNRVLVEVGPGNTLGSLTRLHDIGGATVVAAMRHPQDAASDLAVLYSAAGQLWIAGRSIDWQAFQGSEPRQRVSLPTYAFEHQRYWIDRSSTGNASDTAAPADASDPSTWLSRPVWSPASRPPVEPDRHSWLVFADAGGTGDRIADKLSADGHAVTRVRHGDVYRVVSNDEYVVRTGVAEDYVRLLGDLDAAARAPERVAHLWLLDPPASSDATVNVTFAISAGFTSLFLFARALTTASIRPPGRLQILTQGMQRVESESVPHPAQALAIGPARVVPHELGVQASVIDVDAPSADVIVDELESSSRDVAVAFRGGTRFVERLEEVALPATHTAGPRQGGVYLVTGGSGGLGRAIAEHLARTFAAKVVLVSRTTPADADRFIALIRALGGDAVHVAADVTNVDAVRRAAQTAVHRFGRLSGIYHAAGTLDDGLIAEKDTASCARVLAPKVWGTLAIAQAVEGIAVDFIALFSSTSAHLGLPGQVDYTAANAFLNAFARSREGVPGPAVTAIGWGVWRDAGMAARSIGTERRVLASTQSTTGAGSSFLLGTAIEPSHDRLRFEGLYDPRELWVLDEHRLASGVSVLPGTAYVEIARAAAARTFGHDRVEIRDLEFLTPLVFTGDAPRVVRVEIAQQGKNRNFSVLSAEDTGAPSWTEHAKGVASRLFGRPKPHPIDEIKASCRNRHERFTPESTSRQERYLKFGPRWKTLVAADYGTEDVVAELELPGAFHEDTRTVRLHPALLDIATAAGLPLVHGYDQLDGLFVPMSYGRVRVFGALPTTIVSHVRLMRDSSADQISFDITLTDRRGRVVAEIHDFTMRLDPASLTVVRSEPGGAAGGGTLASRWIARGIGAHDGTRMLDRVLSARPGAEIVVSSIPIASLRRDIEALHETATSAGTTARGHAGADAPSGDVERELAHIWQDLLGVSEIGANDDFFELGGHSLIAVRLVNRIEKRFDTKIRLATLFEARTVRQLAALLGGSKTSSAYSSLVVIQPNGHRPPLFVAHAVGGEVLSYSELARLLGPEQPFYGFRAVGHDGSQALLTSIEDQAAFYIREMRMQQPRGPYYLAGYSHGGRVVYEMALQLAAMGEQAAFVGILDTWPSEDLPRGVPYVGKWLENLPKWIAADFAQSGWEGNWDRVKRTGLALRRRLGALIPGSNEQSREIAEDMDLSGLPDHIRLTYETNFRAFLAYKPRRYTGTVTLFRAYAQPLSGPHGRDLGWGRYAAHVNVIDVPGNHGGLLLQPDVRDLARALRAALADARQQEESRPLAEAAS